MDLDKSPVPSPPKEAPSPPPDDDDFGVNNIASWSTPNDNSTGNIRSDIMKAIKSTINPIQSSPPSKTTKHSQAQVVTTANTSGPPPYDPASAFAAMQQQLQQTWGAVTPAGAGSGYAAISAMMQNMLPST